MTTMMMGIYGNSRIQQMEVLYRIRPYFVGISPYIALTYGRYLQFRFLIWPVMAPHQAIVPTSTMMDFYVGGGIDYAFLGVGEAGLKNPLVDLRASP